MNIKKGFGTNFHSVYEKNPELYDLFSSCEFFSKECTKRINELLSGDCFLDLASGTCHKTNFFGKKFKKIYALDKSKALLNLARKKYGEKINYLWGSADKIPLLDESVDSIIITWGSFPMPDTLVEIKRVLKPGGKCVRVGMFGKDEYTDMFPSFDLNKINFIKKTYKKFGFSEEKHLVDIKFNNLKEAKEVLSKILKIPKSKVKKIKYKHDVSLHYFIKK